ncbi:MAG: ATP-dependent DNA helicase RecG [Erysipelotrichaceae bacterium]|nr:ATP-dependent DNA helicase RecG [Erysipelotrichaceae bacterium]
MKKSDLTQRQWEILAMYDISQLSECLRLYPFRYEVIQKSDEIALLPNTNVTLEGIITSAVSTVRYQRNRSVTRFTMCTEHDCYTISAFNRPWFKASPEGRVTVIGRYEGKGKITAANLYFKSLAELTGVYPVYPLKEGVKQTDMRKIMQKIIINTVDSVPDEFPESLRNKYRLLHRKEALRKLHLPKSLTDVSEAARTLKYEEFLRFQMSLLLKNRSLGVGSKIYKEFNRTEIENFIHKLPFPLTADQQIAVSEILDDMSSTKPMMRLLQGDVGSGKTIVGAIAMFAAVKAGYQAAMMAPTEILVSQHVLSLRKFFLDSDTRVEGLTSSLSQIEKTRILSGLSDGSIDMIIGTHALFQSGIEFKQLGLVITDEQHRFGVNQRRALIEKGADVDVLTMSATPIPRTLAAALFADMDVSTIATMPSGRMKVQTILIEENSIKSILDDVLKEIAEGNQVYVVCPAIEESDALQMRNVTDIYRSLEKVIGKKVRMAMLHGQLRSEQKEKIMNDFHQGHLDLIVTTTVIEVGVHVENANIMIIYDAYRFGLSQLHQLRGRIGRGSKQGICYLLSGQTDEESKQRLLTLVLSNDGFDIAMKDLSLRGPGDLLGKRQSGLPHFILGDILADQNILLTAKEDAKFILDNQQYTEYQEFVKKMMVINNDLNQGVD